MGLWSTKRDGVVIGDKAADVLDEAIKEIHAVYSGYLGRGATRPELIALMRFCCGDVSNGVVRLGREPHEDNNPRQPTQNQIKSQDRRQRARANRENLQGQHVLS